MSIAEMSDRTVMEMLGARIQRERLNQNLTQQQLAERAGLGLRTVKSLEAGQRPMLETVIRALRALGRLAALDAFLPEPEISPLQLAKLQGRVRQRASGRKGKE